MEDVLISGQNLCKYYREPALDNVSFEVQKGSIFGLVGKNGAGKPTLLRLSAGELSLDRDAKRFDAGVFLLSDGGMAAFRENRDPSWLMKAPLVVLCAAIVLLGLCSTPLVHYFQAVAGGLL